MAARLSNHRANVPNFGRENDLDTKIKNETGLLRGLVLNVL